MDSIEHPETIMLIHKTMVKGEMERNRGMVDDDPGRPGPTTGPGGAIRATISRWMIATARWLDPEHRPVDHGMPAGEPN